MFPFTPIPVDSGMAFRHNATGETLCFDKSWFGHLDIVEKILWDNHFGNYQTIYPGSNND